MIQYGNGGGRKRGWALEKGGGLERMSGGPFYSSHQNR